MDSDPVLEELMSQIGDWGRYQFRQHLLHLLGGFLAGLHMLSITAIAQSPNHRCYIEELDNSNLSLTPTFNKTILSHYIPLNNEGELEKCSKFFHNSNATEECHHHVYDTVYLEESRVMEWDMVCDKRWERAAIQAIYIFGVLVGAIVLGPMADKYGRKTIFYISGILQVFTGLASAFAFNFPLYCVILFFYGAFASAGSYISGFCLSMELVGPSKRTVCGTAFSAAFAVGVMVVAIWGYLISNITLLQVIYSLHSLSLFAHWWLIDESIRWLWGQGRTTEAIKIVREAAIMNGKPFDNKFDGKLAPEGNADGRSYGISDLFKTPVLRSRAINVAFNWFANSIVYYGLSLNTGNLEGNPYIVLFFIGLAEIPGYILVIALVDKTGRRCLCSSLMLLGGFACIIVAFIPTGLTVTAIVMVGKMAIAGSFAIIYNYTAELFPTVVRNSAIGIGAMAARFSGMLTPLLGLLDSVGKQLPTVIFGSVAIVSALCTLFLPETLNKQMPQTVEEGERFGVGDTGYRTCLNFCRGQKKMDDEPNEVTERLNPEPETPPV